MCLTWKLSASSVTFKMRERIAVFSFFIKRKELMCLFVSFCFVINVYKTFFFFFLTPSPLKSSLTLAQQIFLAWFSLNHVFFHFWKSHSTHCDTCSSDRNPRKLMVGSLAIVCHFGKPSHMQLATRCISPMRFVVLFSSILPSYLKGWKIKDDELAS